VTAFGRLIREVEPHALLSLGDQLVLYTCHHHSIFLDQTAGDALGGESWGVRRQAAFEASHALLASLCHEFNILGPNERLDLATELFSAMGHGRLNLAITAEGGEVHCEKLHYGAGFAEKYGGRVKTRRRLDAFAAGYVSAAASLAFPSDWGALEADETSCIARGDGSCVLSLSRRPERARFGTVVTRQLVEALPHHAAEAPLSPEAQRVAAIVGRWMGELAADDYGKVRVFGTNVAVVPVSYCDQVAYDTMHLVEKRAPELFPVALALTREAAELGTFHLLGGILASPEWLNDMGAVARDIELRLQQCVGITRALGWGAFEAVEFSPGRQLVLRAPATHESVYYAVRHGSTVRSRLAFQQGLALGIMQLLHRVDFSLERPIEADTYDGLFKHGTRFHVEETKSPLRGDRCCEVVVEALADR
jgi:hypothetical protein